LGFFFTASGGNRGICFGTPWENPPSPPFTKGGILFTDKFIVEEFPFLFFPLTPALSPVCGGEGKGEGA